ncbi:ZPR1 zinc finger domain-containing protein [Candidatus Woesearchaeota archaeon]|nr:MAG: ZPR1 zinc finger domain-containing protein [Candidatus Woesearchaeota archaeon]
MKTQNKEHDTKTQQGKVPQDATPQPMVLKGELCPVCHKKTLTLMETPYEIPFFGTCSLFSMDCEHCKYHKADVEFSEKHPPAKFTLEVSNEEDLKARVIKSASATIKIPHLITIESTEFSNGYVTNVEGVLNRIRHQIAFARDDSDDPAVKKKAKQHLKKIDRVLWGKEKLKLILEDPSGNSAIISPRAQKTVLKKKS